VHAAIYKFEGQIAVFNYKNGPSYRCLFPDPPKAGSVPNCSEVGVLGVLPGILGAQQANEAIKIILELGEPLSGKLLNYNVLTNTFSILNIKRSDYQVDKVLAQKDSFEDFNYDTFCGIPTKKDLEEITVEQLKQLIKQENLQIIDVREEWEEPQIEELKAINLPLSTLIKTFDKIDKNKKTIIFCQNGTKSIQAIKYLNKEGFEQLINLRNGITTWLNN